MSLPWRRRKTPRPDPAGPGPPRGDPEGVARAERELAKSEGRLERDRRQVIEPLRYEAYRNNIQALLEGLIRKRGGAGHGADAR